MEWTDKYAPKKVSEMVGPKTPGETLLRWLRGWKGGAALLAGPTGVGKTLLAHLACKEVGLHDVLEINGVSKRTKKTMLKMEDAFKSQSVQSFFSIKTAEKKKNGPSAVILDDVDTCDQGGLPQILLFVRKSVVPVIFTSADGYNHNMKPLNEMAMTIRMYRPTADQIAMHLVTVARIEGKSLLPSVAKSIAMSCNCDVRQSVLELRMGLLTNAIFAFGKNEDGAFCDHELGLFNIPVRLFVTKRSTQFVAEADRLYKMDPSVVPLMVHENYAKSKGVSLDSLALASEAMSMGDTMNRTSAEFHGFFSTTLPCALVGGPLGARVEFPAMLNKISATIRVNKMMNDMRAMVTTGTRNVLTLLEFSAEGYAQTLQRKLVGLYSRAPTSKINLAAEYVAIEMHQYGMGIKEWNELSAHCMPASSAPKVSLVAKAALIKAFNKRNGTINRPPEEPVKKKAKHAATVDDF